MSNSQQPDFNLEFIKDGINEWSLAATTYQREAEKAYTRIRSYLTLYQFRLSEQDKCDIREMLTEHLDEIDKNDLVADMDSYLDGFCFKLDKSVLSSFKLVKTPPTEVKIAIAQPETANIPNTKLTTQTQTQEQLESIRKPQKIRPDEPVDQHMQQYLSAPTQEMLDTYNPANNFSAVDYDDLDFYTRQFFQ